jgi:hypothetical protein
VMDVSEQIVQMGWRPRSPRPNQTATAW